MNFHEDREKEANCHMHGCFFFLLQFFFFFALKCVLQQAEGAAAEMRVDREPRRVEKYSVSLEHVSL